MLQSDCTSAKIAHSRIYSVTGLDVVARERMHGACRKTMPPLSTLRHGFVFWSCSVPSARIRQPVTGLCLLRQYDRFTTSSQHRGGSLGKPESGCLVSNEAFVGVARYPSQFLAVHNPTLVLEALEAGPQHSIVARCLRLLVRAPAVPRTVRRARTHAVSRSATRRQSARTGYVP